jgi:membrane protein YqaA with SNARE-associated domain
LAAVDAFVFFVPNEMLLIPAVLMRRKHWFGIALWTSVGSAIGAALFGYLTSQYGEIVVNFLFPSLLNSKTWLDSAQIVNEHGSWGLAVISLSPLPQHAAVAIAGLAHLSTSRIFLAVLLGRAIKYLFLAWCCIHSPRLLEKLRILPKPQDSQRP